MTKKKIEKVLRKFGQVVTEINCRFYAVNFNRDGKIIIKDDRGNVDGLEKYKNEFGGKFKNTLVSNLENHCFVRDINKEF